LAILALIVVVVGILFIIPSTRASIIWHISDYASRINMWLNPPAQVGFNPDATAPIDLQATLTANAQIEQRTQTPAVANNTLEPIPLPTATAIPLPASASIPGGKYFSQHGYFNYCAPANLAMELSYWGWNGTLEEVGNAIKPYAKDKNVMPYEMIAYAESLGLKGIERVGGDVEVLKRFINAGYPVLIERGVFFRDLTGITSWMGHYGVVTGYDDTTQQFTVQDSYIEANHLMAYEEVLNEWRSFNYTYVIVYSPDRESQALSLLGEDADEAANFRHAWVKSSNEVSQFTGTDLFFAWYNVGTNLVGLQDYTGAAAAYDQAFAVYNTLPEDLAVRPYRILWYETGAYKAYFYTGRYQGVIDLATNNSLGMVRDGENALEESYYWRGMAENMLGETDKAIADFREALYYHENFTPAVVALQQLGVNP